MSDRIAVWVYPTRSCNFRCTYCYEEHDPAFMSTEIAERTVEWAFSQASLAKASGVSFNFFGGEPLLGMSAFRRVVLYGQEVARACGNQVRFRMNTNGSLITEEAAKFLADNEVALDLSLDGDKATNDRYRKTRSGKSAYDEVGGVERIAQLRDLGVQVSVNMVVGPETIRSLSRNVKFFWRHGITALQALPLFDGGPKWGEEDLNAFDEQLKVIAAGIVAGVIEEGKTELLSFSPFSKVMRLISASENQNDSERTRRHTYCGIGRWTFAVDINGNIYSCPRFIHEARIDRADPNLTIGNVWEPKYNLPVVERFKRWNPRQNARSICSTCDYALTCIYQCAGENLAWQGDEYEVAPIVCRVTAMVHKHARDLFDLLHSGEGKPIAARA